MCVGWIGGVGWLCTWLMTRLAERGLAMRFKKGTYLIERRAVEEVLTALRQWI